ncbi:hypothetical protein HPB50_021120 [Hyalomma asiaticum]|uniref:Uncharacterized protein n=1 Tax=Hyalomma asiaticum TaxID=266040 RepID=A0ACB7TNJ7_HYAAI|nr:hypothetical protein HPB50_021120 [Hyalomma asiaticum]
MVALKIVSYHLVDSACLHRKSERDHGAPANAEKCRTHLATCLDHSPTVFCTVISNGALPRCKVLAKVGAKPCVPEPEEIWDVRFRSIHSDEPAVPLISAIQGLKSLEVRRYYSSLSESELTLMHMPGTYQEVKILPVPMTKPTRDMRTLRRETTRAVWTSRYNGIICIKPRVTSLRTSSYRPCIPAISAAPITWRPAIPRPKWQTRLRRSRPAILTVFKIRLVIRGPSRHTSASSAASLRRCDQEIHAVQAQANQPRCARAKIGHSRNSQARACQASNADPTR